MPPLPSSPIKIAILDDYQDTAAALFASLGPPFEITSYKDTLLPYAHPSTPEHVRTQLVARLQPYTIISSMRERTPFPAALLAQLPNLKLLLTTGTRNKGIDIAAARKLGIPVTGATGNGPSASTKPSGKKRRGPDSTTQHTVALILGLVRNLADDHHNVRQGNWQTVFATGLSGKTFSTLGLGRLGSHTAKIMYESFGMRVLCWSSSLTQDGADQKAQELGLPVEDADGKVFQVVSKEQLFRDADVLSVHYVLSDRSRGIVGQEELAWLKRGAFLVNTSRGPLVDDDALFDVLSQGKIRGAALDVFELEPLPTESRWRSTNWGREGRSRVLLTPHMGYGEEETMANWYAEQVEIVERWHRGEELLNVLE